MKIEVGKVYRCGDGYVRTILDMAEQEEWPDKTFIPVLGAQCHKNGVLASCKVGAWITSGEYLSTNPPELRRCLQPIKTPQQTKLEELEQTAQKIQEQIKQLREEM